MNARMLITAILLCTSNFVLAGAENHEHEAIFSGSEKKVEEGLKTATDVVIAKFISLGTPSDDAPGAIAYRHASIEIISCLRGSLSGLLKATYYVQYAPKNNKESLPVIGAPYILFIKNYNLPEYRIEKMLPSNEPTVASVKASIAARLKR